MMGSGGFAAGEPRSGGDAMTELPEGQDGGRSRAPAVIGLVVVLALVVAGVFLFHALRAQSQLQDCLMSGRTNCAPIEVPPGNR
jgi:hypothetical protein